MMMPRLIVLSIGTLLAVVLLWGRTDNGGVEAQEAASSAAPIFEVDPFWPMPLPNNWLLGSTIGVSVDSDDHVWIVHRGNLAPNEIPAALDPPFAEACCYAAPPILEFDQEGNLLQHWGGPGEGYDWPESNHGVWVDHMDNVWIGGNGGDDSHALKFSHTGQFLLQVGEDGYAEPDSNSWTRYQRVAKVTFDAEANEAYLADGYGNKRVAVVDGDTGELKRYWGAYGNVPSDDELPRYDLANAPPHGMVSRDQSGAQQFRNPVHCADPTNDGLVYACDRPGNRVQVFTKAGEFVEEIYLMTKTLGAGAVWDIAFSTDPDQAFAYVADGMNEKVHVLRRKPLEYVYSFGSGGRMAGQFYGNHSIAVDSMGNIYTTETYEGKRVQRFKYMGMGSPRGDIGVPRPNAPAVSVGSPAPTTSPAAEVMAAVEEPYFRLLVRDFMVNSGQRDGFGYYTYLVINNAQGNSPDEVARRRAAAEAFMCEIEDVGHVEQTMPIDELVVIYAPVSRLSATLRRSASADALLAVYDYDAANLLADQIRQPGVKVAIVAYPYPITPSTVVRDDTLDVVDLSTESPDEIRRALIRLRTDLVKPIRDEPPAVLSALISLLKSNLGGPRSCR